MHVLVSAYACSPSGVSEAGNGWGWAVHLAERNLQVHVLTVSTNQQEIESELLASGLGNLRFSFVEPAFSGLRETTGMHYFWWQVAALKAAQKLHRGTAFDVAHHVTYGSVHVPTLLWRLGIPVVFGPVGGGQTAPKSLLGYFEGSATKERLRTAFTSALLLSPYHRLAYRRIRCVLATNYETLFLVKTLGSKAAGLGLDTGLHDTYYAAYPRTFGEARPLKLLWVGRMMPRKGLALTLDGLAASSAHVTLTILGEGIPKDTMAAMLKERGLEDRVIWSGKRSLPSEVREAYATHDALLFTSLRESFGSQHLEAMAMALPVITLNQHGARTFIPPDAALKVPVVDKAATVAALARAIEQFAAMSPERRDAMSAASLAFALDYTWKKRAERAEVLYRKLIALDRAGTAATPADLSIAP